MTTELKGRKIYNDLVDEQIDLENPGTILLIVRGGVEQYGRVEESADR